MRSFISKSDIFDYACALRDLIIAKTNLLFVYAIDKRNEMKTKLM